MGGTAARGQLRKLTFLYYRFYGRLCGRFSGVSDGEIGRKLAENVQRNARETASTMTE